MSKRVKLKVRLVGLWFVGLMAISAGAFGQSLFPGLPADGDLLRWVFMFILGAAFSIFLVVYDRAIKRKEKQREEQVRILSDLNYTVRMMGERQLDMARELGKSEKRMNRHFQWIQEHTNCHAEQNLKCNKYIFE